MAAATVATAAGAAVLLYLVLSRRFSAKEGEENAAGGGDELKLGRPGRRRRIDQGPAQPPSTWREAVATLSETVRFAYSETLEKWPIADLAFGIKFLMRRQGNPSSIFAGSNCIQLKGPEIMAELIHLLRLLDICMLFSKKPFPVFLEYACYSKEDALLQEPQAELLKPAFTILRDKSSKCFLLIIRGMHSIKDILTAATGAVVPFHHLILHEGGVSKLVLGYAHCGMLAAARWIAKFGTPCLLEAVRMHPDYNIKIVGNSLGGGIAALLTYILRENVEFSSSTCIAFAPAACMSWDLAESGNPFVTTIINGSDLVPTCSIASLDNLRSEVKASSWLNDLLDQFQHKRLLTGVRHSMLALRSHIPFISSATVSSKTQVVSKSAQNAAQAVERSGFSICSSSCVGACQCAVRTLSGPEENARYQCSPTETFVEEVLMPLDEVNRVSMAEETSEGALRSELEMEESATLKEIAEVEDMRPTSSVSLERHRFFPPGKIMHIVAVPIADADSAGSIAGEQRIGIYETPRNLYGKIRLAPTMIEDHYMPAYKKMIQLLIDKIRKDEDHCTSTLL